MTGVVDSDDTHGSRYLLPEPDDIFAGVFIGPEDGVEDPIGPEDVVAVDGDVERMLRRDFGQHHSIASVQIGSFDLVEAGVRPVELLRRQIQRQSVGHPDVAGDDRLDVESAVVGALDGRSP